MNFKILKLSDFEEWNELVSKLPDQQQDIYYTPDYYSLYENYGDGEALCFIFELDGEIALYPFLFNSINRLGYSLEDEYYDIQGAYGYNGVISSNYSPKFINAFYSDFSHYCKNNNVIVEFTRFHPLLYNHKYSSNNMEVLFDRTTVTVDLSRPKEEIFNGFQNTTKKQIRRCKNRYGIEIIRKERDLSYLDDFIRIYSETMRRVNSIDYLKFNAKYFKDLFLLDGTIQYFALLDNKPIASITSLMRGEYMHGHLGGALTNYLNISTYSLLYWEMIKTAKEKGTKYLHIGGGATSTENDKLLVYKKHFSSNMGTFFIGKKIHNQAIYQTIVEQWKSKFPESYKKNQTKLLGYREIKNGF